MLIPTFRRTADRSRRLTDPPSHPGFDASFLMPYGHPAPLVQEPVGYRQKDYLRFGAGLVVLAFAVILILVLLLWLL